LLFFINLVISVTISWSQIVSGAFSDNDVTSGGSVLLSFNCPNCYSVVTDDAGNMFMSTFVGWDSNGAPSAVNANSRLISYPASSDGGNAANPIVYQFPDLPPHMLDRSVVSRL